MRTFRRALTGTLAAAALASGILAGPAAADPSDGQGCAGVKTVPAAYVCVISVTPQNALPTTSTTGIPVSVPPICYVAGCTNATTVTVPVPGVQPGGGVLATLWYQGVYYPIAVGTVPPIPTVPPVVWSTVQTVVDLAGGVAGIVVDEVNGIDPPPTSVHYLLPWVFEQTLGPDTYEAFQDFLQERTACVRAGDCLGPIN
jgi:hypothetical protein